MKEIPTEFKERNRERELSRIELETRIKNANYASRELIRNGWTRHEMFEEILGVHPPRDYYKAGDRVIVTTRFGVHGGIYCYDSPDDLYKPGDHVVVRVGADQQVVTVESVGYYSEEEYPFYGVYMREVEGPADEDLVERYKTAIDAEKLERDSINKIRETAKKELEEARSLRREAEKEKAEAALELAEAKAQSAEAKRLLKKLKKEKEAAKIAVEATEKAGEEARKEHERLKAAEKEASKVWKRERPETDNEIILSLRGVQDALDEDETIYTELSALEFKMSKVMEKADELIDEEQEGHIEARIRKLYEFYLPKTIEVMEQYKNIFISGLPPKSVEKIRGDVLVAIDKSNQVYNNILESLYERDMLELLSEMKALQAMFAIEGLLNSDFDVKL